ncbi:TonB family C-terminal domain-containing protein [Mariprofundus aestuarium]|uniref:TonB family C-terminal domain-containing protein n=1 Tax=Mariprofundus aestuarium TaxID=1921086 RepID=A0A2K8L0E8_MARES|nr:TonB C-terminal domain-containing protein [Mariprofundus aestuarium]ATX80758.1 TonB family C-terminal domain-containing protein [Mariprofundus aestuarium]
MNKIDINTDQRRIGFAFIASIALHILLVVLIDYVDGNKPLPKKDIPQIMDVVLLDDKKTPSKKAPKDAKTMSNRSATGGSKADDRMTRQARAPMSGNQQHPQPSPPQQPKTPPPLNQQSRTRLMAKRGDFPDSSQLKKQPKADKNKTQPKDPSTVPLSNLMPSAMALSQLSRDFERERRMKQKLTKEADVSINTRQAKYAPYAQALVRALEEQWRPGQANYEQFAEEARRSMIKLTIDKNGDLAGIEILRPSPIPQINNSAIEAINAAAPFKVLPSSWGLDRVNFYLTFEVIEDRFVFRPM